MENPTRKVFTAGDLRTFSLNKPDESWPVPGLETSPGYPAGLSPGDEPEPADVVWLNSALDKVTQSTALDDSRRELLADTLEQLRDQVRLLDRPERGQAQAVVNFTGALVQVVALPGSNAKVATTMESTLRGHLKDVSQPELVDAVERVLDAARSG